MPPSSLDRLRRLCLAFPEALEIETWGAATFRVRNKIFAMHAGADDHQGKAVWLKAKPGNQDLLVRAEPERYFAPPYVGPRGWIGVRLGRGTDWRALEELLCDAYRLTAPKRLAALMAE
jgi:hypothetical protein